MADLITWDIDIALAAHGTRNTHKRGHRGTGAGRMAGGIRDSDSGAGSEKEKATPGQNHVFQILYAEVVMYFGLNALVFDLHNLC